jgi:predicted nucleic acid-binding protein
VYVETSIVSYATAHLSREPHVLVRQQEARRWWQERAPSFELFASQVVFDEAARGDQAAAKSRLALLAGIELIPLTDKVVSVARELLSRSLLPPNAGVDALHVAAAAVGGVDYLLTLNCRHIANAFAMPLIYRALDELNVHRPLICTPAEFLGADQ